MLGHRGVGCEYYNCEECTESYISACTNAGSPIENMGPKCSMFKVRTKRCDICKDDVNHWHMDGKDGILCQGCYDVLYEQSFISAGASLEIRRKALKDLVARVRDTAIAKKEDKITEPVVIGRERYIGLKMLAISMREHGLISEDSLAKHLGVAGPDYLQSAIRRTKRTAATLEQEKEKANR